uniref:Uncharacterized protein n=1 Tax=Arundo donax TaxID=35708 RepID=A0A0A9GTT9_ARUDO
MRLGPGHRGCRLPSRPRPPLRPRGTHRQQLHTAATYVFMI